MFRATKWRSKKNMIKAIFKLQFWATQVPQLGWDSLMVSLVPVEVGKPTAKSEKAAIHEGNCQWENPIYETVRFTKESKYGKINKKIYRFLILTGSLKAGLLGEVTIDFADYAEAIKPSSVSLPLKASNSGGVLHVRIQRIRTTADAREVEENGDVTVRSHGRTLKSELRNCDTDGSCNTCSDISNCNCTEDSSSVTGIMQSSLSHDKAASRCAESDGILRASSCSDSTSASNCSSGKETPHELGFKNSNIHRDMSRLPLSVSNNALPLKRTADAVHSVTDFRQHRRLNTECSVSSAPDGSLDDSTNSFEGTHLKERSQASHICAENLKNEMIVLARQADVSELELQTLRKQIAKERHTVQDLSWEVRSLKEERDGLNRECEKLKALQQNSERGKVSAGLKFEREDLRNLLVEIEQELDYAKVLNINLQLQLQKTQESNSELIHTVQDLEERLEKKNKGIQEAESGNGNPLLLPSEMNREDHNVPISNIEYSLKWKIVQLCNEIEVYRKDREELETQMEQLALDYEILKLENHSMTLKLEQTQLQEQLTMPSECSAYLAVMDDLEAQLESLEKELEKRAEVFEADLAAIGRAKVEQEQRAIRAEEALRKIRWNNASTAERLQEEFNNLAMQMSLAAGKLVCVTGASGYIASWLVKLLLDRGYSINATVRDPNDPKKTEHLRSLDGAKERLHLFKANLLEDGAFNVVVDGCEGVFHTASPFYHAVTDPQAELIDPAVKGTLNVLGSCAKTSTVKRVVVTSSMAAVAFNKKPRTPDVVVDETWFSDPDICTETQSWYMLSKTLAEEAAWKFAKEKGIDMVTINPAMVIGPLLQPTLNTSAAAILNLINGSPTFGNLSPGWVHVKDVAEAHILAFEVPSASGRYCLVERVAHYSEIVKILREHFPVIPLPEKCADDKPFMPTYQVSKERAKGLGIKYIPLDASIKETVESLKEKGFAKF